MAFRRAIRVLAVLALIVAGISADRRLSRLPQPVVYEARPQAVARAALAKLPLLFEENRGQTDPDVRFLARGPGFSANLSGSGVSFLFAPRFPSEASVAPEVEQLRMSLVDAHDTPRMQGLGIQPSKSHYLRGTDEKGWIRDVSNFAKVFYHAVYPGIDLVFYGNQQSLEYDFVVAPAADPAMIGLSFKGLRAMSLDAEGNLVLEMATGRLVQKKPVAYQLVGQARRAVSAAYRLLPDQTVGFSVGTYDANRPLVIDPVLVYSSFLGGNGSEDFPTLAVDQAGSTYLLGMVHGYFPLVNPVQPQLAGAYDLFISKLNAAGTQLVYSTYLGGGNMETRSAIALDAAGNAYVTGCTESPDFPTSRPMQSSLQGETNAFITKIAADGRSLVYSTYWGQFRECGTDIAVDSGGNAIVVGTSEGGPVFPADALQPRYAGGLKDGFVVKLVADGSQLAYGTYLGGTDEEHIIGVALDQSGNVYVTGSTYSVDFPVRNALQAHYAGDGYSTDAFVGKITADGKSLAYGTYLGGADIDYGFDIALDAARNIYVSGITYGGFPTKTSLQPPGGKADAFVTKLAANGQQLIYSTYLGGSENESAPRLVLDARSAVSLAGSTQSPNFPVASPWQRALGPGTDAFVAKLDTSGRFLAWSSFLGGIRDEWAGGIGLDGAGRTHVTGDTRGFMGTTAGAFQPVFGGLRDAFVARIDGDARPSRKFVHGDSNDDGRADLLWRNDSSSANAIWDAADATLSRPMVGAHRDWSAVGTGDFNGDRRADILWRNRAGMNVIWRSAQWSDAQGVAGVSNPAWEIAGIGDFNGDAQADLLWRNDATGANVIWRSADASRMQAVAAVASPSWHIACIGDFDGNGRADVFWRNHASGQNVIWLEASSTRPRGVTGVSNLDWVVEGAADFDGDGRDDLLWRNVRTGSSVIWKGASAAAAQAVYATPIAWAPEALADYDGDGKADILWRNSANGAAVLWYSANATTRREVTAASSRAWSIVP